MIDPRKRTNGVGCRHDVFSQRIRFVRRFCGAISREDYRYRAEVSKPFPSRQMLFSTI
jgi:hypothetical protein